MGERRFRDLADRVPVPIWIVAPDGRLIYSNQAWADASGGDGGRARGDTRWLEVSHPDDRGAAISAFRSSASRRERFDVEVRLQAVDGAYRWWSLAGLPRLDMDGRLVSYVGVCVDATASRGALRSLNEARAKLVTAQEAERSRIARELHDDLGQQLALLASRLDAVTHRRELSRKGCWPVWRRRGRPCRIWRRASTTFHTSSTRRSSSCSGWGRRSESCVGIWKRKAVRTSASTARSSVRRG